MIKSYLVMWTISFLGFWAATSKQRREKRLYAELLGGPNPRRETHAHKIFRLRAERDFRWGWFAGVATSTALMLWNRENPYVALMDGMFIWLVVWRMLQMMFKVGHPLGADSKDIWEGLEAVPVPLKPNGEHGDSKLVLPENIPGVVDQNATR